LPPSRLHIGVTQALLALILLVCLPFADLAGTRGIWLGNPSSPLVVAISEGEGDAEAAGPAVGSLFDWSEADEDSDGDDDLAAAYVHLQNQWATDRRRALSRVDSGTERPRAHPATGPPLV
jgi:hypothetical protein